MEPVVSAEVENSAGKESAPITRLRVVEIPTGNLQDVPGMLRRIADQIDAKERVNPDHLIMVFENPDGSIDIFGLGDFNDTARVVGLLAMAQYKMAHE